jgi:chemotaxis protein CheC
MSMTIALDAIRLDALKEVGNVGAGHAMTSFATMLDRMVNMSVPHVGIMELHQFVEVAGGAESLTVGVYMPVEGEAPGHIAFLFPYHTACDVADALLGNLAGETTELDEMSSSVFMEVGNILASSFLIALCEMTGLDLRSSPPALAVDMTVSILSSIAAAFNNIEEDIVTIVTQIEEGDGSMEGYFIFVPEPGSLTIVLRALGLEE